MPKRKAAPVWAAGSSRSFNRKISKWKGQEKNLQFLPHPQVFNACRNACIRVRSQFFEELFHASDVFFQNSDTFARFKVVHGHVFLFEKTS